MKNVIRKKYRKNEKERSFTDCLRPIGMAGSEKNKINRINEQNKSKINKIIRITKIRIAAAALLGFFILLLPLTARAAGTLSVAVSSGTVATGETMTVSVYAEGAGGEEVTADMTITYDSSKLEFVSSDATGGTSSGGGGTVKATGSSVDIKFRAIESGDAYVKAEGVTLTAAGTHVTVTGSSASQAEDEEDADTGGTKSGDNSLSSLEISPGTLSPAFKGSTTSYTAKVSEDVDEITVTPVTSNSKATVVSVTGNQDLAVGENVITVLVRAENGTEASYKITVTKGGEDDAADASADSGDDVASGDAASVDDAASGDETDGSSGTLSAGISAALAPGDSIIINGVTYQISEDFTEDQIPEGFSRSDFEYKGDPYQGVVFDSGHLGMYYLVDGAGEGGFFVYDADRDRFHPYVRMENGEHFILLMSVPNGAIPPDNYEETTLTLNGTVTVPAYQYAGAPGDEIVNFEDTEALEGTEASLGDGVVGTRSDFYLFYAMDETGQAGWYQYDIRQNTYQRLNEEAMADSDGGEDYETLLDSYNDLSKRYKSTKSKDRRLIAVLIFVAAVFLILILNLLLKLKERRGDLYDGDEDAAVQKTRAVRRHTAVQEEKAVQGHAAVQEEKAVQGHTAVREEKAMQRHAAVQEERFVQGQAAAREESTAQGRADAREENDLQGQAAAREESDLRGRTASQGERTVQEAAGARRDSAAPEDGAVQRAAAWRDSAALKDNTVQKAAGARRDSAALEDGAVQGAAAAQDENAVQGAAGARWDAAAQDEGTLREGESAQNEEQAPAIQREKPVRQWKPYQSRKAKAKRAKRARRERKAKWGESEKKGFLGMEEEEPDFYEDDDASIIGEFEEEPKLFSRASKRREKSSREQVAQEAHSEPEPDSGEDDDIEFLDLNDL